MLKYLYALIDLIDKLKSQCGRLVFKESISGLAECKTPFLPMAIFDLHQIEISLDNSKIELRSFAAGESADPENPSFSTIALENNQGRHYTHHFLGDMRGSLKSMRNKPTIIIDEPGLLMPYYTTHFGHFTGDCLGSIIALSKLAPIQNRKLFFIAPNQFDNIIKQYGNQERLEKISSQQAFSHNLIFSDAHLLPRIGPWQNLSLCSQIFGNVPQLHSNNAQRVFLTSERSERIENIENVISFLQSENFYILNPQKHRFEETLAILRDAHTVISEIGSITHNILIARNKPFYILCGPGWNHLSPTEFAGGGIYSSYKDYLSHYIECQPTKPKNHHPFSDCITVNIEELKAIVHKTNKIQTQ